MSRKLPLASSKINPYRIVILLRLVILGFFFHYRLLNPVPDAYGLWLTSVICEIWFAVSWIPDQFPKWCPIERETYLDRLSLRYFSFAASTYILLHNYLFAYICKSGNLVSFLYALILATNAPFKKLFLIRNHAPSRALVTR